MLFALLNAARAACDTGGPVVINELNPNPTGTDDGYEWVELYNSGSSTVDLTDWKLQWGTSSYSKSYTIPSGTSLAPGAWITIGESSSGADLLTSTLMGMGNASTSADSVQLVKCDASTADTVIYGTPNSDSWKDDAGAVATSLAPKPVEGSTVSRDADGVDSNDNGADFSNLDPTPGATNVSGGDTGTPAECGVAADFLRINEVYPDPAGTDSGSEWVELYNSGSETIDLTGWSLNGGKSSWSSTKWALDGLTVAPGDWVLIGETNVTGADLTLDIDLGNGSNGDGLRLLCPGDEVVDVVIWGGSNNDALTDESGAVATSFVASNAEGESVARNTDGVDTDVCGDDWSPQSTLTPGADNPNPPACDVVGRSGIKLNEFIANPAGSDAGLEWIEIVNTGSGPQPLEGWMIQVETSEWGDDGYTFAAGTIIPAGGHLVIGGTASGVADLAWDTLSIGNGSNTDGIRIVDCEGVAVDTILYGSEAGGSFVDDVGSAGTQAEPPGEAQTLGRLDDGVDTNDHAADWGVMSVATPGDTNPEPPVCDVAGRANIKVNELISNPSGSDDGLEWIELVNTGSAAQRLDGWMLQAETSEWGDDGFVFPNDTTIEPGGYLVVGGSGSGVQDIVWEGLSIGNGGNADGVRLVDCEGAAADTVLYGEEAGGSFVDDEGSAGTLAPAADEAQSIGRLPDGEDSDDHATDFSVFTSPSPGAKNGVDGGGDDSGDDTETCPPGERCGCGKSNEPASPDSGCSYMPLGGLEAALLALALLRRRT